MAETNAPRRPDFKQIGLGGGLVAAIITLTPVKNWLWTREEGVALSAQVAELKLSVAKDNQETTRVVERKVDKILEAMHAQEERYVRENEVQNRRLDGHDQRFESMWASLMKNTKRF